MKTKSLILICFLSLLFLVILGSCATMKSPDKMTYERFVGTWANNDYEPEPGLVKRAFPKIIINPDGTMVAYQNMGETGHNLIASYTVHERWNDSEGNSFYHVEVYLIHEYGTRYELWRINKHNSFWEVQWSNIDYPEKIDPEDYHSYYHIHYRY